jgi:DNA-binding HxlR family transcriptional regulator
MNNEKLVEQWRSACPVARTLDLLADRWSLLIVRDMLFGSSKFQQFLASPENIPTNVLSNRLKMLESTGLLTEKGKKLAPVIRAIADWGESNIRNSREQGRALST